MFRPKSKKNKLPPHPNNSNNQNNKNINKQNGNITTNSRNSTADGMIGSRRGRNLKISSSKNELTSKNQQYCPGMLSGQIDMT